MIFKIEKRETSSGARAGTLVTSHGTVDTPAFMPVGTQGSVKTVTPDELNQVGARMILANTYHLYLRPGDDLICSAGGLHAFIGWNGSILTDSGGFQVFSLSALNKINDEGVRFQSHIDGSIHFITPERAVDIQRNLGSDIMMAFDHCVPFPCTPKEALKASDRTLRWAERCVKQAQDSSSFASQQSLFGIIQGSVYPDIRKNNAGALISLNFEGYAIGGLAVGEPRPQMLDIVSLCTELMPDGRPRYLMGVGTPEDILDCIALGVDMFDCVIPTRNGRNGTLYTRSGKLGIRNHSLRDEFRPVEEGCPCYTCTHFSRAYLRHLFHAKEILGLRLATIHNLHFFLRLMREARQAILKDTFTEWKQSFIHQYHIHAR